MQPSELLGGRRGSPTGAHDVRARVARGLGADHSRGRSTPGASCWPCSRAQTSALGVQAARLSVNWSFSLISWVFSPINCELLGGQLLVVALAGKNVTGGVQFRPEPVRRRPRTLLHLPGRLLDASRLAAEGACPCALRPTVSSQATCHLAHVGLLRRRRDAGAERGERQGARASRDRRVYRPPCAEVAARTRAPRPSCKCLPWEAARAALDATMVLLRATPTRAAARRRLVSALFASSVVLRPPALARARDDAPLAKITKRVSMTRNRRGSPHIDNIVRRSS